MKEREREEKTRIFVVSFYNFKFEFMHTGNKFELQSLKLFKGPRCEIF